VNLTNNDDELQMNSPSPSDIALQSLLASFPSSISDGVFDPQIISEAINLPLPNANNTKERFGLGWSGKREALDSLQLPSFATLVPENDKSLGWDSAENVFIEGDNLEALKILSKSYNNEIRMIYIDPPYNTGHDFIYNDDFTDPISHYLQVTGQVDQSGNRLSANTDTSGRRHSKWLSMMFPRLKLAFNLLRNDGAIFISIGPEEVHHLATLVEEVFGRENIIGLLTRVTKTTSDAGEHFAPSTDFVIVAARDITSLPGFRAPLNEHDKNQYKFEDKKGRYKLVGFYQASLTLERSRNARYGVTAPNGEQVWPPEGKRWRTVEGTFNDFVSREEIVFKETKTSPLIDGSGKQSKWNVYTKQYLERREGEGRTPRTFIDNAPNHLGSIEVKELGIPFTFPKPTKLICDLIEYMNFDEGIILDFFAGSGTTGHAVQIENSKMNSKKRFILVNLPEEIDPNSEAGKKGFKTVSDMTRSRLRKVMEGGSGKGIEGLRCFKIGPSSFLSAELQTGDDQLPIIKRTLSKDASDDSIVTEVLLRSGISINIPWIRKVVLEEQVVICDNILIALAREISQRFIDELLKNLESINTVVFLEDAFAEHDAEKANAHFALKKINKQMKTV
jgi:adenine-specific DNA-methyltransferase